MIFFIVWAIIGLLSIPVITLIMEWQTKKFFIKEGRPTDEISFKKDIKSWSTYYYALMVIVGPIALAAIILYILDFQLRSID